MDLILDLAPDGQPGGKDAIAAELEAVRQRSLRLLEPVPDPDLRHQHSPLMSPLVWDLAHVGNYEDLWLVRALQREGRGDPGRAAGRTAGRVGGTPARSQPRDDLDDLYDAFRHPRRERPSLPLLSPAEARAYVADVRGHALDLLERVELDPSRPLLAQGFVYGMVVQHEHQHDETMLATLQLMDAARVAPVTLPAPPGAPPPSQEVLVDGGEFPMGTDSDPWAYDNERPAHVVELRPFWIDTAPVTNRAYLEFVEAGGYHQRRWWTSEGWAWRQEAGLEHPQFWRREGPSAWARRRFGRDEELPPDEPVQHVCWYEADAYARWRGRRLPTEAEWEKAASWDPAAGLKRRYPWGDDHPTPTRANLAQRHLGPAPVGAYPEGASPWGCHQLVGDVWEWTASDFRPYPGFGAFPYREYSEVFYGSEYKVLRGGSWATHPAAVRTTFRNWDFPIRRQIFCGFRCARDA